MATQTTTEPTPQKSNGSTESLVEIGLRLAGVSKAKIKKMKPTTQVAELRRLGETAKSASQPFIYCDKCDAPFPGELEKGIPKELPACPFCGESFGTELAVDPAPDLGEREPLSMDEYREYTNAFHEMRDDLAMGSYRFGVRMRDFHARHGWATGGFRSLEHYANEVLHVSSQWVYLMITVADYYDEQTIRRLGIARARVLSAIPDEKRRKALVEASIEKNVTVKDLEKTVKAERAKLLTSSQKKQPASPTAKKRGRPRTRLEVKALVGKTRKATTDKDGVAEIDLDGLYTLRVVCKPGKGGTMNISTNFQAKKKK